MRNMPILKPQNTHALVALAVATALCGCHHDAPPVAVAPHVETPALPAPLPQQSGFEVAITFDDLPSHGALPRGANRNAIIQKIIDTARAHHLPPMFGFVNGVILESEPEDKASLEAWIASGNRLGNHTYSHVDPTKVSLSAYLADIDKNDPLLASVTTGQGRAADYKVFRYPYLEEGPDIATREAIRQHLFEHGYRIAQVTIDFGDWAWNAPYSRCVAQNNTASIDALKTSYVQNAKTFLRWANATSLRLNGHISRQILLLHVGAFDSEMFDALLTAYEQEGATFVSLDDAMTDPLYATDVPEAPTWGSSLLERVEAARHISPPGDPLQPMALLNAVCPDAPRSH